MRQLIGEELRDFAAQYVLGPVSPIGYDDISLDVALGDTAWIEINPHRTQRIILLSKDSPVNDGFEERDISSSGVTMLPGAFIKARTAELFSIPPRHKGVFTLRSYGAQRGVDQSVSITLHPNWTGYLIMELRNNLQYHDLLIPPGEMLGQVEFYEL